MNNKAINIPVLYTADENGGYTVFAPTLPGCHSQGDTLEEAENNIREAIELYLDTMKDKIASMLPRRTLQGMVQIAVQYV